MTGIVKTFYPTPPKIMDIQGTNQVSMLDVNKWPIFSILEPEVIKVICKICVFGSSGNEAIYITEDDEVYALGSNCSSCLGLGDTLSSFEPRKIEALSKKKIVSIAFGSGPHVLGMSAGGEVRSWGHNGYCQLGNGGSNQGFVPTSVTTNIQGKKVIQVACGSHHSMALTADGEVFAWGQNNCGQIGSGSTTNQSTPRKVSGLLTGGSTGRMALAIACGQTSSLALIDNGEAYGWGYNGYGQLGLGNNVNQPSPCRVHSLQGVILCQIVCGYAHTMALSDEGHLYAWGANSYGQLGTGNKTNSVIPSRVLKSDKRFIELAAIHYAHISAAQVETGKVYMWGQCRSQSITTPLETRFTNTDDVFATFASPPVTWRTLGVKTAKGCHILQSLANAFDDPVTSDIKFSVEGREIHAHKSLLKIRCDYFRSMFQSHWDEAEKELIEVGDYSYPVYKAFLQYLYTDHVDVRPEEAIGLLDLANAYCEPSLKQECERVIKQGLSVENVAMLYAASIKFQARNLEQFCFRFALNHMTAVTQTEAFLKLDDCVIKEFIRKAGLAGAFKF